MEHIFLPTTIEFLETEQPHTGKVLLTPCHQGYGTTIGNALRRVLLSSLPGAAVESVRIEGIQHEFSGIEGVQEDMIQVILNLKQLAVKCFSDEPVKLSLHKKGAGPVTAKDFEKNSDVEIMNDDLVIATITDKTKPLAMEITVGKGRGYVPAAEKETRHLDLGTIAIDSLYTPIRDVGYQVELTRVGDVTDFEKLVLTVETNGTITPKEAVSQAAGILIDHFSLLTNMSDSSDLSAENDKKNEDPKTNDDAEKEDA
ncbi:MAG TPA: DNA-directed RNA polymerase subunit alpha [Candidatus Magasanikbacteria bacterium]|nr:MAG: DNA-directed RNA polymerase subunit alpha [Candidatus Magasanikbacteria bacterium RIFCSPLOWO2_02_FULL_47_16]OGH80069.1 MAG: DNA-directed RNA polymerase subunit alpha [Candidatus Magasanikbacteria bacterium RIFCSPHIGHO2_02_FULL_48_18]OGH82829.1 MAG: DNA-directed RNA polymerase subunit alpha [Candidatus Magasanikbacteria bacterium RIFCSPLOWO2_12_FULL_47_9b]HAZ28449.1 DNA-directed RNA polymerase subunit alpha [Candidatus Magasanikbacteria bacterium]